MATRVREREVRLRDGRTLRAYATEDAGAGGEAGGDEGARGEAAGPRGGTRAAIFWHHGTPNLGAPPAPLVGAAAALGLRWISYDRPGYGGSTERVGRTVADAAADTAAVADALGVGRFAVLGHSGGGPHALACAALLGDRVIAAVSVSGLAPPDAEGLDWYDGMVPSGVASLRAAAAGRAAKARFEAEHGAEYDPRFTERDLAALRGDWSWFETVMAPGAPGLLDDDIAYTSPWTFDPATIQTPVLLLHGDADGIVPVAHSRWLASRIATAELRATAGDGHLSVLAHAPDALAWIAARA
jgi:pimeloyl-ACP methyl ester carboxylesterase